MMIRLLLPSAVLAGALVCLDAMVVAAQPAPVDATRASSDRATTDDEAGGEPSPEDFVAVEQQPTVDIDHLASLVVYPIEARKNGIEGTVIVQAFIDTTGTPIKARVSYSDNRILDDAAVRAVMAARFTPAIQHGRPIRLWVTVPLKFTLND